MFAISYLRHVGVVSKAIVVVDVPCKIVVAAAAVIPSKNHASADYSFVVRVNARQCNLSSKILLNQRIVSIDDPIKNNISVDVRYQLSMLASINSKPINLFINSTQGSISSELAIYEEMLNIKCKLSIFYVGEAYSMGSLPLLLALTPVTLSLQLASADYSFVVRVNARQCNLSSKILLNQRIVSIDDPIKYNILVTVRYQLSMLASINSKPINLFINSTQGSISSELAIYEEMLNIKCKLSTFYVGQAYSMGSLPLLLALTPATLSLQLASADYSFVVRVNARLCNLSSKILLNQRIVSIDDPIKNNMSVAVIDAVAVPSKIVVAVAAVIPSNIVVAARVG
ncbi:hypothetical protein ZIOFF_053073 [Zingiber officinale]|uniref:ATP-dependent Clp protease proteolytic subunit n=1 Tax=Zingiber officinale TaxID=94328 RepID=A0A8J5FFM8_ZINOF|nr:hypothetical protein ZIOFF_053073 [Zingiber officinale]